MSHPASRGGKSLARLTRMLARAQLQASQQQQQQQQAAAVAVAQHQQHRDQARHAHTASTPAAGALARHSPPPHPSTSASSASTSSSAEAGLSQQSQRHVSDGALASATPSAVGPHRRHHHHNRATSTSSDWVIVHHRTVAASSGAPQMQQDARQPPEGTTLGPSSVSVSSASGPSTSRLDLAASTSTSHSETGTARRRASLSRDSSASRARSSGGSRVFPPAGILDATTPSTGSPQVLAAASLHSSAGAHNKPALAARDAPMPIPHEVELDLLGAVASANHSYDASHSKASYGEGGGTSNGGGHGGAPPTVHPAPIRSASPSDGASSANLSTTTATSSGGNTNATTIASNGAAASGGHNSSSNAQLPSFFGHALPAQGSATRALVFRHGAYGIPKGRKQGESLELAGEGGAPAADAREWDARHSGSVSVGEDAYFLRSDSLGVADGVGAWSRHAGANPARWSRKLMHHCAAELSRYDNVDDDLFLHYFDVDPVEVLQRAFDSSLRESKDEGIIGSSTALLAVLRHDELRLANMGDCCCFVIRGDDFVFRLEEQQHSFNFPVQVGTTSKDIPSKDAQRFNIKVQKDDIVVLSSDGLVDNLFDDDILEEILRFVASSPAPTPDPQASASPPPNDDDGSTSSTSTPPSRPRYTLNRFSPAAVSEALCMRAKRVYEDQRAVASPFALRAMEEGIHFAGGKRDDVTTLIGVVGELEASPDRR